MKEALPEVITPNNQRIKYTGRTMGIKKKKTDDRVSIFSSAVYKNASYTNAPNSVPRMGPIIGHHIQY